MLRRETYRKRPHPVARRNRRPRIFDRHPFSHAIDGRVTRSRVLRSMYNFFQCLTQLHARERGGWGRGKKEGNLETRRRKKCARGKRKARLERQASLGIGLTPCPSAPALSTCSSCLRCHCVTPPSRTILTHDARCSLSMGSLSAAHAL